jgi:hemerythrin-like domain-containing protein
MAPTPRTRSTRVGRKPPAVPDPSAPHRPAERPGDPDVAPSMKDLGLELYRQQTLLSVMTARMRETASRLLLGNPVDPERIRRGLDVHRRFLLNVHDADEDRVARALEKERPDAARKLVAECRREHARAETFLGAVQVLLGQDLAPGSEARTRMSTLFAEEADRIDRHQTWEDEKIHPHLDTWLSRPVRSKLLEEIRRFNAARVDAEIALVSWASQLHPSAD